LKACALLNLRINNYYNFRLSSSVVLDVVVEVVAAVDVVAALEVDAACAVEDEVAAAAAVELELDELACGAQRPCSTSQT